VNQAALACLEEQNYQPSLGPNLAFPQVLIVGFALGCP